VQILYTVKLLLSSHLFKGNLNSGNKKFGTVVAVVTVVTVATVLTVVTLVTFVTVVIRDLKQRLEAARWRSTESKISRPRAN